MKTTFIYGLVLEGDDFIRYVGKSDNPKLRLKKHINNTKLKIKDDKGLTHKDYWLIKHDYKVSYIILEECDYDMWQDREIYHINKYNKLTNTSSGGLGGAGIKYTLTYNEVKSWVHDNTDIKSKIEWSNYIKTNDLPKSITPYPYTAYKNRGWVSWGDFLGTNRKWDNDVDYLDYESAKKQINNLNLTNITMFKEFMKNSNIKIPLKPNRFYKNRGWVSWGDFLGTNFIANQFRVFYPYDEFKIKIKELDINTYTDYKKYILLNKDDNKLPTNPNIVYKNKGWVSWQNIIL